jgi:hypothetical protein
MLPCQLSTRIMFVLGFFFCAGATHSFTYHHTHNTPSLYIYIYLSLSLSLFVSMSLAGSLNNGVEDSEECCCVCCPLACACSSCCVREKTYKASIQPNMRRGASNFFNVSVSALQSLVVGRLLVCVRAYFLAHVCAYPPPKLLSLYLSICLCCVSACLSRLGDHIE